MRHTQCQTTTHLHSYKTTTLLTNLFVTFISFFSPGIHCLGTIPCGWASLFRYQLQAMRDSISVQCTTTTRQLGDSWLTPIAASSHRQGRSGSCFNYSLHVCTGADMFMQAYLDSTLWVPSNHARCSINVTDDVMIMVVIQNNITSTNWCTTTEHHTLWHPVFDHCSCTNARR